MTDRPPIPAQLERELMLEAGYRCSIPTCRATGPLEIDHIIEYSEVKEHEFSNMIVLCRNCHGLKVKGADPRKIDRKALLALKHNLGLVNNRYNDTERRVLEYFTEKPDASYVLLPGTEILYGYLLKDGLIEGMAPHEAPEAAHFVINSRWVFITRAYVLTESGHELVRKLRDNLPADDGDPGPAPEDG
jgi:hypothetical protein